MKHIENTADIRHQELFQLLPWYVNKTLQGTELKAVEEHLCVCLTCKREYLQLQNLGQAIAHEGSLDTAELASFSRLRKRIHKSSNAEQRTDLPSLPQNNRRASDSDIANNVRQITSETNWKTSKRSLYQSISALAAVVLLSVLAPRYVDIALKQNNDFRTLSSDKQQATNAVHEIRVVFADGISQQQKDAIVARIHGHIIDKPTPQGVYNVQLSENIGSQQILDLVETLRNNTGVIFAEPSYALLSSTHTDTK
ncbi:MAG: hypothetical protein ABL933_13730 [Methyloglobulus sp.]|nr:hypothetical protein [Methyloglobulus sp.]